MSDSTPSERLNSGSYASLDGGSWQPPIESGERWSVTCTMVRSKRS